MGKQIKPLQQQIDEYKSDKRFSDLHVVYVYNPVIKRSEAQKQTTWNWSDDWDGQLIKDVLALELAGFTIVSFSRKRKVTLKYDKIPDTISLADGSEIIINKRAVIVDMIIDAVGDTWYSISFKPTLSIYSKGRSSTWYR